jgi:nitrite reductase/ring-hydroxylating ferredoxin subunit
LGKSFRFPGIPVGWYTIATSGEVKTGQVVPLKYFGEELVLYRTESGHAQLSGAYCPHLGAHLAKAKIRGDNLECPFHGFQFGMDGRCVHAYGKAVPRKAKLDTWPVREHNGFIFAWYHPERTEPEWEIPILPGPKEGWTRFRTRTRRIASHPQETSENSVDVGHFSHLHTFKDAWYEGDVDIQGHLLKGAYGLEYGLPGLENVKALFHVEVHGLGYSLVRITLPRFDAKMHLLVLSSPVDAENIVFRTAIAVKHWGPRPWTYFIREATSLGVAREISQDAPIWESKRYVEKPMLAEGDGPIAEYRRYCKQFYPQATEAQTTKLPVVAA